MAGFTGAGLLILIFMVEAVSTPSPAQVLLKVGGSLLAVVTGASAGVGAMLLFGWEDWRICLMLISFFAVPVWALVLLPMHVLLPPSSEFWRPSASVGVGGTVGAIFLTVYFVFAGAALLPIFLPIGVLVGIVTGLAGSAVARLYAKPKA